MGFGLWLGLVQARCSLLPTPAAASANAGARRAEYSSRYIARDMEGHVWTVLKEDTLVSAAHNYPDARKGQVLKVCMHVRGLLGQVR